MNQKTGIKDKAGIYLLSIVGIVAVVALVVLLLNQSQELVSTAEVTDETSFVGQAIFVPTSKATSSGSDSVLSGSSSSSRYCADSYSYEERDSYSSSTMEYKEYQCVLKRNLCPSGLQQSEREGYTGTSYACEPSECPIDKSVSCAEGFEAKLGNNYYGSTECYLYCFADSVLESKPNWPCLRIGYENVYSDNGQVTCQRAVAKS